MDAANDIRETREKQGLEESVHYILKDHLGSWTAITDADGNVEQELSYDAWGSILASKSAATLPKEVKATMRHTKDVIDNKRIPGEINNFVDFSAGLISGQAKKVIDPPNAKSTSSYRPPMILAPQKNDKAEQSIYQKMIYSK